MKAILVVGLLLMTTAVWAANYTCATNAAGENVLDTAILTTHLGLTKAQVVQRNLNDFLRGLGKQQDSDQQRILLEKISVATNKGAILNTVNATITPPTITDITDQTHNVAASPVIPIVASNPYPDLALSYAATGLPPGMRLGYHATTGAPQLQGTLTTAGTYNVTVSAWNDSFTDIKGTDTFVWTVNP